MRNKQKQTIRTQRSSKPVAAIVLRKVSGVLFFTVLMVGSFRLISYLTLRAGFGIASVP